MHPPPNPSASAFLAVRIDPLRRRRLKAVAALRGESLQSLVTALVDDCVAKSDAHAVGGRPLPILGDIVGRLRKRRTALAQLGVRHLHVFGSVARGDAGPASDIDIAVDFAAEPSLVAIAGLRARLEDILDSPVDLAVRRDLKPGVARAFARDAVAVF